MKRMSVTENITRRIVDTGQSHIEAYFKGNPENPLIIFLHGFPEYWKVWIKQITYFADAGYYVCAPNQRGYGHSSAPTSRRHYSLDKLSRDITGLIEQLPHDKAVVIGHDWGGGVVYHLATRYPQYISHAVILNMPIPISGGPTFSRNLSN